MRTDSAHAAGGLYEVCIGVPSLLKSTAYFERFGYRAGPMATLDADRADALYGVASAAQVVRLLHGTADHGLIRLIEWDRPAGPGLQRMGMRTVGSRWSNNHTRHVSRIHAHAEMAAKGGQVLHVCPPAFAQFGHEGANIQPFEEALSGVYELTVLSELYRQCFFERIDYPSPLFGNIDDSCLFQTSQITHCGLVTSLKERSAFEFYDRCLGLKRVLDADVDYGHLQASRAIFDIPEGLGVHALAFDEPRSGSGELKRSGRLLIFNFVGDGTIQEAHERSRAGVLGYSHYTWRVRDLAAFRRDALEAGATDVGEPTADEFGCPAWSCHAPDGYFWTFLQAASGDAA